ncbi:hypothetical protein ACLOJK_012856 [Asimina triloba]
MAVNNVMLAIHEKKTSSVEMYRPLRQYIAFHYSEREAHNLEDDLQAVRLMRSDVERPSDSPDARRDLLHSYYRALCVMESRFPISPDRDHINAISFTWCDAFKPNKKATQQNIHLEKAALLFNLGAVYSQIALSADRTSANGLKQACSSFQSSAGAFAFLKDNESAKAAVGGAATVDLSGECAGMLEKLMLAQAQECFFEKVIADGKPPGLCAKVARQVGIYYEEAHAALNLPPLNLHFDRTWISHVQLKAAQFYAEACYRFGLELHEKEEIAEEIARLKSGITALADAKKSLKGVAAPLLEAVTRLDANLNQNLERATKENDRVYLMRVPASNSLPPLPTASLVKPTPMTEILDASKEKMFTTLVPDSSAKSLSKYTEMVDDIIRTQAEKLQQGSEITRVRLKEMDLPDSILALEGDFTLPVDLKEDVEAVQIVGGPSGLEAELQQLKDLRRVNQELLVQTEELLQKELREDSQFRSQFGTRWTRPHSSTLTKNLQDRLNRFAGNLKQAAESDARIERAAREHSTLMGILDHRPIEAALPSLARPIMSLDANEDAIVGALKQSLRQLETLGAQRAGLEDMLKEMKRKVQLLPCPILQFWKSIIGRNIEKEDRKLQRATSIRNGCPLPLKDAHEFHETIAHADDDILPKLMTTTGSHEDLFRKEISKYDHICEEIAKNIEAQEQLLLQIQEHHSIWAQGPMREVWAPWLGCPGFGKELHVGAMVDLKELKGVHLDTEMLVMPEKGVKGLFDFIDKHEIHKAENIDIGRRIDFLRKGYNTAVSYRLHKIRNFLERKLLRAMVAQNDHFSAVFNLEDYRASREKTCKQIAAAVSKFREIKDNINEGLKFYVTLQPCWPAALSPSLTWLVYKCKNREISVIHSSQPSSILRSSFTIDFFQTMHFPTPFDSSRFLDAAEARFFPFLVGQMYRMCGLKRWGEQTMMPLEVSEVLELHDAITNVKQQCSDFVMTRNIQCREMIEDVQRQVAEVATTILQLDNNHHKELSLNPQIPKARHIIHAHLITNLQSRQQVDFHSLSLHIPHLSNPPTMPQCLQAVIISLNNQQVAMNMGNLLTQGGVVRITMPTHSNLDLTLHLTLSLSNLEHTLHPLTLYIPRREGRHGNEPQGLSLLVPTPLARTENSGLHDLFYRRGGGGALF